MGALLDPVADKALLVSMYVTLAAVGEVPDWLAILVVFRDLVIVGGVIVLGLLGRAVVIRPLFVSKVNTTLQIVLVALTLLLAGLGVARAVGQAGADLGGGGEHARLRRGLCVEGGARPMTPAARASGAGRAAVMPQPAAAGADHRRTGRPFPAPRPSRSPRRRRSCPAAAGHAQPAILLAIGLVVLGWLVLRLFASVLRRS